MDRKSLIEAFAAWEVDRRDGACRPQSEVDAMPVEECAAESADALLNYLEQVDRKQEL